MRKATVDRKPVYADGPSSPSHHFIYQTLKRQSQLNALYDPYETIESSKTKTRKGTGITYDKLTDNHKCEWDEAYPEGPHRFEAIFNRCNELGLIDRCQLLENMVDVKWYIETVHTLRHMEKLEEICKKETVEELEKAATDYDSVYFNKDTYDSALRAVGAVLGLVREVAIGEFVTNGIALVRPPGHHATIDDFNGYCFFNNVAIAAEMCIIEELAKKILIVDIDVHHGQGTQRYFYNRSDVLYFSIHRYEHGAFWPNLHEGNLNFIGIDDGYGYNINVPLNKTGMTDGDYLAILFNILLPVAYEFQPDLIIVSAGYDAAIGCVEGNMNITPGFYSHLITLLSGLANGKIAVCLEGGYFLPSLAEGVAMTMKALLGDPCPILDPFTYISPAIEETILCVQRALWNRWNCFKIFNINKDLPNCKLKSVGLKEVKPFKTRQSYMVQSKMKINYYTKLVEAYKERYNDLTMKGVCVFYDERMLLHRSPEGQSEKPERPDRLTAMNERFLDFGLYDRCIMVETEVLDYSAYNPHNCEYMNQFKSMQIPCEGNDVYWNEDTFDVASLAVSGVMAIIDKIFDNSANSGVALIRPPGHHAEPDIAKGYCVLNNVAIAANYLIEKYDCQKVLIFDFDVHHGNGTQNFFYMTEKVLYISIHRYDEGKFFPKSEMADYNYIGLDDGEGYNINIPFSNEAMGDSEYMAAFLRIVLPIAYSYAPDVVLVSAGFDAGIHDPLGSYKVTPELFGHFIQMLKPLAGGKIILLLEGGYNLATTSYSMAGCAKVLLGDTLPVPEYIYRNYSANAGQTIRLVADHIKNYWRVVNNNHEFPKEHNIFARGIRRRLFDNYIDKKHSGEVQDRLLREDDSFI